MSNISELKSRKWLILPYFLLAVLVLSYSLFWFWGKSKAEERFKLALQARSDIACENRTISGFPFSYTLMCDKVAFTFQNYHLEAPGMKAMMRLWNPRHVITDVTSPLTITPQGGRPTVLKGEAISASFSQNEAREQRLSLVVTKGDINNVTFNAGEIHLLRAGDSFRNSMNFSDVKTPFGDYKTFQSDKSGVLNLSARTLKLDNMTLQADQLKLKLSGDFALTPDNRPHGKATVAFAGFEAVAAKFGVNAGTMRTVTGFLGKKTQINGEEAIEVPLDIREGRLMLGPIALYTFAPLF